MTHVGTGGFPAIEDAASGGEVQERFRDVVFAILPDMDSSTLQEPVKPHPDGRPWLKACKVCALRTSDPQRLGDQYQQWIAAGIPGHLFYCVHRETDGCQRVCACFAALKARGD